MVKIKTNIFELAKARILAGYTVAEFADKVGCSRQNLYMIESNKSRPTPATARKITEILGIEFGSIFSIVDGE